MKAFSCIHSLLRTSCYKVFGGNLIFLGKKFFFALSVPTPYTYHQGFSNIVILQPSKSLFETIRALNINLWLWPCICIIIQTKYLLPKHEKKKNKLERFKLLLINVFWRFFLKLGDPKKEMFTFSLRTTVLYT